MALNMLWYFQNKILMITKYTSEIFDVLRKGQFICSNSPDDDIQKLYKVLEDDETFEDLHEYFYQINYILEQGNEVVSSLNCTLLSESPVEANLLFEHGWIRMESWWLTPGPITIHQKGRKSKRVRFRVPGNGYQFEAAEVMQCLDGGLTESPSLPLDFSLDLIGTLDAVRASCGIRYPQDET